MRTIQQKLADLVNPLFGGDAIKPPTEYRPSYDITWLHIQLGLWLNMMHPLPNPGSEWDGVWSTFIENGDYTYRIYALDGVLLVLRHDLVSKTITNTWWPVNEAEVSATLDRIYAEEQTFAA